MRRTSPETARVRKDRFRAPPQRSHRHFVSSRYFSLLLLFSHYRYRLFFFGSHRSHSIFNPLSSSFLQVFSKSSHTAPLASPCDSETPRFLTLSLPHILYLIHSEGMRWLSAFIFLAAAPLALAADTIGTSSFYTCGTTDDATVIVSTFSVSYSKSTRNVTFDLAGTSTQVQNVTGTSFLFCSPCLLHFMLILCL